jgi:hypothetical protein
MKTASSYALASALEVPVGVGKPPVATSRAVPTISLAGMSTRRNGLKVGVALHRARGSSISFCADGASFFAAKASARAIVDTSSRR